jgi:hypothetical protein
MTPLIKRLQRLENVSAERVAISLLNLNGPNQRFFQTWSPLEE